MYDLRFELEGIIALWKPRTRLGVSLQACRGPSHRACLHRRKSLGGRYKNQRHGPDIRSFPPLGPNSPAMLR